jgi:hypothetical protein
VFKTKVTEEQLVREAIRQSELDQKKQEKRQLTEQEQLEQALMLSKQSSD